MACLPARPNPCTISLEILLVEFVLQGFPLDAALVFQVAQFNHSHTVADIRRFIAASRPDLPAAYSLMTAFPSAQLTDDSKTISDAGLLNAVIIQKM